MLRRFLLLLAAFFVLVTVGCTSSASPDADETTDARSADAADGSENTADTHAEGAQKPRADLRAREVSAVDGVRTLDALEDSNALRGTWSSCTLEGELADLSDVTRSPLRRVFVEGEHLYAVFGNDKNELWVRGYTLSIDNDACAVKPWRDFGNNGQLDIGTGVADVSRVGEVLVATGIETTLYTLDGTRLGVCDALSRFTRVRGRSGTNDGVARKGGKRLLHVAFEGGECTVTPWDDLEGDETLGMRIAPVSSNAAYAILQADRVPNALAYLEDGAVVWRYFPGNDGAAEQIGLVTQLTTLGRDALVMRSLKKSIDVIDADGNRRAKVQLEDATDIDPLTFPDVMAAVDDHRVLVVLRHHKTSDTLEALSLRLLTFHASETP